MEAWAEIDDFNAHRFELDLSKGRMKYDNVTNIKNKKIWTADEFWEKYDLNGE
mgnify:CR=1 FL=1